LEDVSESWLAAAREHLLPHSARSGFVYVLKYAWRSGLDVLAEKLFLMFCVAPIGHRTRPVFWVKQNRQLNSAQSLE
jgi:hypothetical protein